MLETVTLYHIHLHSHKSVNVVFLLTVLESFKLDRSFPAICDFIQDTNDFAFHDTHYGDDKSPMSAKFVCPRLTQHVLNRITRMATHLGSQISEATRGPCIFHVDK